MGRSLFSFIVGLFLIGWLCELFYDRIWLLFFCWPLSFLFVKLLQSRKIKRQERFILLQFQHLLTSLMFAMSSGKSIENAFAGALTDLRLMNDSRSDWLEAMEVLNAKLKNGTPIEVAFASLASRYEMEDINTFHEMLITVKRRSGQLLDVIRQTAQMISEKLETENEIAVLIAAKKWEVNVLFIVPLIFLSILKFSAANYLAVLYDSWLGGCIMTASLLGFIAAYRMAQQIILIEI
jgi:tight adherence protein B